MVCTLGYDLDPIKGVPREDCPKPLSNTALITTPYKYDVKGSE